MPRGAGLGDEPDGAVRRLADGGGGFEYFYGFIGGETNQYAPALYEGTTPVEPDRTPEEGYHFTEDMTDKAIAWIRQQKALMPDKPFFIYFAPGATHAPHHVPPEWSDKYKGKFDDGWDALREETFARQKELGVIPADAELTAAPRGDPGLGRHARGAEAGARPPDGGLRRLPGAHRPPRRPADRRARGPRDPRRHARLLHHRRQRRLGRGHPQRHASTSCSCSTAPRRSRPPEFMAVARSTTSARPRPTTTTRSAGRTRWTRPYQWTKQVASHWGGTRNGTIVHWPAGIEAKGEVRNQFSHVIDVAPTILDAAGLPAADVRQRRPADADPRPSMAPTFDDAGAPEHRETQYFEMFVNRGIYHQGWTAVTRHSTPWVVSAELPALDDDVWELYGPDDWTQAHDLAAEKPEKLHELQRLFLIEAMSYDVLPLDDRRVERFNPDLAGRPTLIHGNSQLLFGGMERLTENSVLVMKNKSHSVTAEIDVPDGGARRRDRRPGRRLRRLEPLRKEGRPIYCYNLSGSSGSRSRATSRSRAGRAPGPDGVRLRRRRPRQGRRRHALRRRREGRRGPGRGDACR